MGTLEHSKGRNKGQEIFYARNRAIILPNCGINEFVSEPKDSCKIK